MEYNDDDIFLFGIDGGPMLDLYEALEALKSTGTMGLAGARLRISQSAVSKRIAALEAATSRSLIERHGRRVVLTPDAEQLIARISPLLATIRSELTQKSQQAGGLLEFGVSESVLASWGAELLFQAEAQIVPARLSLHAHRGPLLTQLVGSGRYLAALMAGDLDSGSQLASVELGREPMVVLAKDQRRTNELISIEPQAATWQAVRRRAIKAGLVPDRYVESYFAAASLAAAGFGRALVPAGVAMRVIPARKSVTARPTGISRPICLIGRKQVLARQELAALAEKITQQMQHLNWQQNIKKKS
jgi:DNA-binding transcriptional LysR family regulator